MNVAPPFEQVDTLLAAMPVVAILQGIEPNEAVDVVEALHGAGIRIAEVTLNSSDAVSSIETLCAHFGERMLIGGGTVTQPVQVRQLAAAGARLCVMPNTDPAVIIAALELGLVPMPGCATATEAFAALAAGARHLKFFAAAGHEGDMAALKAVLPRPTTLIAVGGVGPANMRRLRCAGIEAFGIGSDVYKPGRSAADVRRRAHTIAAAVLGRGGARLLCNPEAAIGESPVVLADGSILWTDPVGRRLLRYPGKDMDVDMPLWSLAEAADGIVGTCDNSFCAVDPATGNLRLGPAAPLASGCRLNDMAVDPRGGLWAGAMHRGVLAGRGSLVYAPDLETAPELVAEGLGVPNGMAFTPDGRTLFVIDTLARTLLAYSVSRSEIGEPVIVTDFLSVPGKPDGMTLAPDGSFWVAMWGGNCVVNIAGNGAVLRTITLPAPHPSSVYLQGETLYITTSRMRLSADQIEAHTGSGGLFAVDLGFHA